MQLPLVFLFLFCFQFINVVFPRKVVILTGLLLTEERRAGIDTVSLPHGTGLCQYKLHTSFKLRKNPRSDQRSHLLWSVRIEV